MRLFRRGTKQATATREPPFGVLPSLALDAPAKKPFPENVAGEGKTGRWMASRPATGTPYASAALSSSASVASASIAPEAFAAFSSSIRRMIVPTLLPGLRKEA